MTQTITIQDNKNYDGIIELTQDKVMGGDVFYGNVKTILEGKLTNITIHNHLKDAKKMFNFRVVTKCKAGFLTITDLNECSPESAIRNWKKNALQNVQVEIEYQSGKKTFVNVLTMKSNKFYSIDKVLLECLTIGDIRQVFPKMADSKLWERLGAKNWADKAFVQN